jgi:hypothetical protein
MDKWGLLFNIPRGWEHKADIMLASVVGSSFLWAPYVNDILTMLGLGLGVFIAGIRAYKSWRDRYIKD